MAIMAAVFRGQLRDLFPASESQPIIPGFAEAVARGLVFLSQFVALYNLRENSFYRKIVGIDDRVRCSNGRRMVRVARRRHGQTTNLGVLERVTVIAAKRCRGIENLDRIDRQRFQSGKTDSGPKQIIRVRRNGEPAALVHYVADLPRRLSL